MVDIWELKRLVRNATIDKILRSEEAQAPQKVCEHRHAQPEVAVSATTRREEKQQHRAPQETRQIPVPRNQSETNATIVPNMRK
jgi:hypothetical protein